MISPCRPLPTFCIPRILFLPMTRQSSLTLFKIISLAGVYGGLLMPLVFIPIVIFPFVFSKLIAFQILIGLTFPAYLALAWMEPAYRPPKSALYIAVAAYFGALLLSVIFSVDPHRSWWGNQERMNGMFTLLHFFAWLTMAIGLMKKWDSWKKLLNYEVVLSVFMAIVAIMQRINPDLLTFHAAERVGGLLDNPIYMGAYQIFNLSFIALLFLKTKNKAVRAWYGIAALIDLAAFFLTQSRGALFGLLATVGVFAVYYTLFSPSKKARLVMIGGAIGVFGLYALAFIFRASSFVASNSILSRLTNLQATTETRLIAWEIAWKGFLERPLTGWGFDAFYILFNSKYNPRSLEFGYYETWFDRAHNTIMDTIAMTGLFGLITYLAIFVVLIVLVWRAHRRKWIDLPIAAILVALPVGYFLQNLFVFDHPAAFSMSYLLFALVIAATRPAFIGEREEHASSDQKSHEAPWISFALLQLLLLAVVWNCSVRPFQASRLAIAANNYLSAGQFEQGVALMKQSIQTSSLYDGEQAFLMSRDFVSFAEQGALQKQKNWQEAYAFTKELNKNYLAKHPLDTNQEYIYARLLHTMFPLLTGDEQKQTIVETEQAYLGSLKSSPDRQQLYFGLARFYSQVGQGEKTLEVLKKSVDADPNVGESWWYYGLVQMLDMNKPEEGAEAILKSQTVKTPFAYATISDAIQIAHAAALKKDVDVMKKIMARLASTDAPLSGGSIPAYLEIARSMEQVGLLDERNMILNALAKSDESLRARLAPLAEGKADTIEKSFAMTTSSVPVQVPPTASSTQESVQTTSTEASANPPTQLASSSAAGAGPRKR